jgi:hypothetical protein
MGNELSSHSKAELIDIILKKVDVRNSKDLGCYVLVSMLVKKYIPQGTSLEDELKATSSDTLVKMCEHLKIDCQGASRSQKYKLVLRALGGDCIDSYVKYSTLMKAVYNEPPYTLERELSALNRNELREIVNGLNQENIQL